MMGEPQGRGEAGWLGGKEEGGRAGAQFGMQRGLRWWDCLFDIRTYMWITASGYVEIDGVFVSECGPK